MTPEEFQKFMHARGVRREQELNRLEDHVKQSFKVRSNQLTLCLFVCLLDSINYVHDRFD